MNTRKDNNGSAIKAWRALGLAKIEKPLRYIKNKCARVVLIKGEQMVEYAAPYSAAKMAANAGNGRHVQALALHVSRA